MKTVDIESTLVNVPMKAPIRWSLGARPGFTRAVIRIKTDEGIIGIGETIGDSFIKKIIDDSIKPKVMGKDPFHIEEILRIFQPQFGDLGRNFEFLKAYAGVEMALWDIIGKAVKRPLWSILGGKFRENIPVAAYIFSRYKNQKNGEGGEDSPEKIVRQCKEFKEKYGFGVFKYKGGVFSPEFDIETVKLMREELGENAGIRIDPNAVWSVETSILTINKLKQYNLEYYEDVTSGKSNMAKVRRDVNLPFATNMCVVMPEDLPEAHTLGSIDIILGDLHFCGGLLRLRKMFAIAEFFGYGVTLHSVCELGISTACNLHFAAATYNMLHAIDSHYPHQADDIIKGGKHKIANGCFSLPEGNGLGVEIDEDKFAKYAESYNKMGEYPFYYDPEHKDDIPVIPKY